MKKSTQPLVTAIERRHLVIGEELETETKSFQELRT